MIPRRAFVIVLGVTGFAASSPSRAQPPGKLARAGYISNAPSGSLFEEAWRKAFVDGLRAHGWVENQNVVSERRYAYVASFSELFRRAATYVDKILRGRRRAICRSSRRRSSSW
jgi:hypothetical protein